MHLHRLSAALWTACLLCGCSLIPRYQRPTAPIPNAWPDNLTNATAATATQAAAVGWQDFVTDEKLRQVIALALQNNRDLRLATLNVDRARALYGIQRDALFPSIWGTAAASKQRAAADLTRPGQPRTTERYDVNLGVAAWEIDLFGRIRSLKEEALQTYLASDHARRAAQLSLIAAVTQAYYTLAADRDNLALARRTLHTQQQAYELVNRRVELGLVPELDALRARSQVDTARGIVALFEQLVAQDENALQLLVGETPPAELLPTQLSAVKPPADVAAGLPSEVLLNRPDVLAAEHQLRAANADIGAARAAFFPRITLTAAIGTASDELSRLFQSANGTWSYAPQLALPIFDARTWSAHRAAKVQRDIAVAQYEKAIQTAFREVADALAARANIGERLAAQESLVRNAAETYRLASERYEKGLDSYLSVLDAQRALLAAEQALISLRLEDLASRVRLYAVLGGGTATTTQAKSGR